VEIFKESLEGLMKEHVPVSPGDVLWFLWTKMSHFSIISVSACMCFQVAFLIADRAKLMEEIDILKKLKISNGVNGLSKEGDLLSEIIKVKYR
jgi:hypothetical protein